MTVWLCGNSHVVALQRGLAAREVSGLPLAIFPFGNGRWETMAFSAVSAGRVVLTHPEYATNLEKYTGRQHVGGDDLWGLCLGTHNARVYRADFWIDAEPSAVARDGARPVSDGLLDAMILQDQHHIRAFIAQLVEAGVPHFVVSCPPPRRDHQCFDAGTRHQTVAYIDRRARELFRGWLAERRTAFVDVPPETVSEDGFLKPAYNAPDWPNGMKDPHHANRDYGVQMIDRVIDHVRSTYGGMVAATAL